jgi:membrane-associated phospholipid phosphatase
MPSGHSQTTFFSIAYLYLTIHQIYPWVLVLLFLAVAVMFQRVYFHNHTVTQVVVGAVIGSLIAAVVVYARDNVEKYITKSSGITTSVNKTKSA